VSHDVCSSFLVTVTTDSIQFGHFYDDHLRVPYLTYFRLICKIQGIESNGTVLSLGEETFEKLSCDYGFVYHYASFSYAFPAETAMYFQRYCDVCLRSCPCGL